MHPQSLLPPSPYVSMTMGTVLQKLTPGNQDSGRAALAWHLSAGWTGCFGSAPCHA